MKKVILTLFILSIATYISAQNRDSVQLGKAFLDAVKTGDFEKVKALVITVDVMRAALPKEAEGKTDEQLKAATVNNPKLKTDFENIITAAKTRRVNRAQLVFESVNVTNPWGGADSPRVLSIIYKYDNNRAELAITCIKYNNQWYMIEILTSTSAFREFIEEE